MWKYGNTLETTKLKNGNEFRTKEHNMAKKQHHWTAWKNIASESMERQESYDEAIA